MTRSDRERARMRERFIEYRQTGDRRIRNELVEMHRPLAFYLARRYANRGEPLDDLAQVACLGILKAVERFDPDRNLEFSTFASATVNGELKRHFRDKTWAVRVPRRAQELHLRLGNAINDCSQRLGRTPSVAEIAVELGVTEDEVLEAMDVSRAYRGETIDRSPEEGSLGDADGRLRFDDAGFDLAEHRVVLERALDALPERERRIVELRFFEERTQSEIAREVGISQMHVSRLLARVLARMREEIAAGA